MKWVTAIHDQWLKRLCAGKVTAGEIAKLMGFSRLTINRRMKALKLQGSVRRGKPLKTKRDEEIRAKHSEGASIEALAVEHGLSAKRIRNIISGNNGKEE